MAPCYRGPAALVVAILVCLSNRDAAAQFCRTNYQVESCGDCNFFLNDTSRVLSRQCSADPPDVSACTALSFQDLHIWELEQGIFDDLSNLETLELSLNQIQQLREDEFKDLASLRTLRLDHNQLRSLPLTIFNQTTAIEELYLDNNFFRFLDPTLFQNFTRLHTLHLHHNFLSEGGAEESIQAILDTSRHIQDFTLDRNGFQCIRTSYPIDTTDIDQCAILLTRCGDHDECRCSGGALGECRFHKDFFSNRLIRLGNCSDAVLKGCISLELVDKGIRSLQQGVLNGLVELETLSLADNVLPSNGLPAAVFQDLGKLKSLFLGGNLLAQLSKPLLSPLTLLETLDVQNNRISALQSSHFEASPELTLLTLSGNRLTRSGLPEDAFQGIPFLDSLRLDNNNIQSLPSTIFAGLSAMHTLHMYNNRLTESGLPAAVFEDTIQLEQLYLNGNNFAAFANGIFNGLTLLTQLDLSDNAQLASLRSNLFSATQELTDLRVANGRLQSLPSGLLSNLNNLLFVDLQGNRLTALAADTFSNNNNLVKISLENNNFEAWTAGLFDGLPDLNEVKVAGNPIGCFPVIDGYFDQRDVNVLCVQDIRTCGGCRFQFDFLTKSLVRSGTCPTSTCTTLNLDNSGIESLSTGVMDGMDGLTTLNLEFNAIDVLDANVFKDLIALRTLQLNNNKLVRLPAGLFERLSNLRTLYLHDNLLNTLTLGTFSGQTAVTALWLDNNRLADNDVSFELFANISLTATIRLGGQQNDAVTCTPVAVDHTGNLDLPPCDVLADSCGACRLLVKHSTGLLYRERECSAADISAGDCSTLDLSSLGIKTLDNGVFDGFTPLQSLGLQSNSLSALPAARLLPLTNLQDLDVSFNSLTEIPAGAVSHMAQLTRFAATDNQLAELPAEVYDLPALNTLELENNGIQCAEVLDAWGGTVDIRRCTQLLRTCGACSFVRSRFEGVLSRTGDCSAAELNRCSTLFLFSTFLKELTPGVFAGMTELSSLNLAANSLTTLPAGIFSDLSNLQNVYLNDNAIRATSQRTFEGLPIVRILNLQNNRISNVRNNTFVGLGGLVSLNLAENRIAELEDCAFCGLVNVKQLFLQTNEIETFAGDVLRPLVSLEQLLLKANRLETIRPSSFAGLSELTDLELNSNRLETLPQRVFQGLTSLDRLTLGFNPIKSLPAAVFGSLTALTELRLENTNLTTVDPDIFQGLSSLESLFLHRTPLQSLPSGVFRDLTALRRLDAFECQLTTLPAGIFENCQNLDRLELDSNSITELPIGIFSTQTNLAVLHMNDNQLTSLPNGVFNVTSALADLDLDNNALSTLPVDVFENTPNLQVVKMEGNDVVCAPIPERFGVPEKATCNTNVAPCSNFPVCPLIFDPCVGCRFFTDFFTGILSFEGLCTPGDCTTLNLQDRKISGFSPGVLDDFVNVEVINLGNNLLDENDLAELGLAGKPNLKSLLLNDNKIRQIPPGLLEQRWNLETLDLENNLLTNFAVEDVYCVRELKHLKLSHNRLRSLPTGAFDRSYKLESLNVSYNMLASAPRVTYGWVHWHLDILNVSFNQIVDVPALTFDKLCVLRQLLLNDNRILELGDPRLTEDLKELRVFDVRNNLLAFYEPALRSNLISLTAWRDSGNPFGPFPPSISTDAYDTLAGAGADPIYAGLARVTISPADRDPGGIYRYSHGVVTGNASQFDLPAGTVSCQNTRATNVRFTLIETSTVVAQSCEATQNGRLRAVIFYIDESFRIVRETFAIDAVITGAMDNSLVAALADFFSIFQDQVLVQSNNARRGAGIARGGAAPDAVELAVRGPDRRLLAETVTLTLIASNPTEYQRLLAVLNGYTRQELTDLIIRLLGLGQTTPPPPPPPPSGGGGGGGGGGGVFVPPPTTTPEPPVIAPPPSSSVPKQEVVDEGGGWSEGAVIGLAVGIGSMVLLGGLALLVQQRRKRDAGFGLTRSEGKAAPAGHVYLPAAHRYGTNPYAYLASPQSPYTSSPPMQHSFFHSPMSAPPQPLDNTLYTSQAPASAILHSPDDRSAVYNKSLYQSQASIPPLYQSQQSLYQSQRSVPPTNGLEMGTFSPFSSPQKSMVASPATPFRSPNSGNTRADLLYRQAF